MNNEIGRKLTSLTLMTIMLAGGMTIAAPSMMVPEAQAAGALYVSAENAMFGNTFGGAQVVEVVVIGHATATDVKAGEPTVKVYEQLLRMAQGVDGNWYGYFGSSVEITAADTAGNNLEYGTAAANPTGIVAVGTVFTAVTSGTSTAAGSSAGTVGNAPMLSNWNNTGLGTTVSGTLGFNNLEGGSGIDNYGVGQINADVAEWPFIQLFDFTIGTFDVVYEQAGADEVVSLDYNSGDLDDFSSVTLDRNAAPQGAQVHLTITDNQLNIDPTAKDVVIFYVDSAVPGVSFTDGATYTTAIYKAYDNYFDGNGVLLINNNTQSAATVVLTNDITLDDAAADNLMVFFEGAENSGVFFNTDDDSDASLEIAADAKRGTTATITYNGDAQSLLVANSFGTIDMDETSVGDEWNSGEALTVTLLDGDMNLNTGSNEDLLINNSTLQTLVPSLQIGSPLTVLANGTAGDDEGITVSSYSKIAYFWNDSADLSAERECSPGGKASCGFGGASFNFTIPTGYTGEQLETLVTKSDSSINPYVYFNYDFTSFTNSTNEVEGVCLVNGTGTELICSTDLTAAAKSGVIGPLINPEEHQSTLYIELLLTHNMTHTNSDGTIQNPTGAASSSTFGNSVQNGLGFVGDVFAFGERINNAIYRIQVEESGDDTSEFVGTVEFIMLNQLNHDIDATYTGLAPVDVDVIMIVHEDMTDEDSPRVNYNDLGEDGITTQIADQQEAPTHSGVVSFDNANYKIGDTVVVTLEDQDMNTDAALIDVYITSSTDDKVGDGSGTAVIDITFDDQQWLASGSASCTNEAGTVTASGSDGLFASGFTMVESSIDSGTFVGSFQVPTDFCNTSAAGTAADPHTIVTVTGTDIEVNYQDYRDAAGEEIETGAGAAINAHTGTVSLDRTVYPVPFAKNTSNSNFAVHTTVTTADQLAAGNVSVHVRISDPDYNVSATGSDTISDTTVKVNLQRGSNSTTFLTFGNAASPIDEVSPDSGVFEYDVQIGAYDGPNNDCPSKFTSSTTEPGCILQGDIITVEYTDLRDAAGKSQTVTDSATFDLRNGVLQADKSVYLIGSDMILTLIEPDLDLDNDAAESYTLDLVEWDSDAATTTLGGKGVPTAADALAFDPEPSKFRETGDSTGIFQVVIEIPSSLSSSALDRGEKIDLEYTDWGPAGADYVGQEDEDIGLTVYTSNFGATIELDQKVYTWTDKVYITIVAPDHNMDSGLVDEIGADAGDPIKVSSRGNELAAYKLVESGADTGIFIGEVTLAGMKHDADGDGVDDITATAKVLTTGSGPTEGKLAVTDNDGITVSFEFSEDETVVGSALVRWNIGEVQWLEASYPASGTGVVRVIDADMNLNPEAIDNFSVDAWSDSDAGGISLTVTETNEATGIFEGTVFFTVSNDSSGHRLRVAEGDTVTAEYEDNTLPDPYTTADELDISTTTLIGTIVPPLERAPAANLRTVDAFGNSLTAVGVDQQVQIAADLANGQDREQSFAYLVQIQDGDGVTVSLAWITGSLSSGQSFSPALSWIPTESGSYTATAFVWESVDNPTALSPPVSTTISVQ